MKGSESKLIKYLEGADNGKTTGCFFFLSADDVFFVGDSLEWFGNG